MQWDAVFTLFVLALTIGALVMELASPELVMMGALSVLMLAGVVPVDAAVAGFGSVAVISIGALFVVAAGVRRAGVLARLADVVLGRANGRRALLRLMLPAGGLSAFLNNTPIVAMFVPAVLDWCKRNNLAPSRFLIPLSYATVLGGTCTLIGTSTTLVVDGLLREAGLAGFEMFEMAWVGVPACAVGLALTWALGPKLLPDRRDPISSLEAERREYLVEMLVEPNSTIVGKSIADAGLRNLPGLYLLTIERAGAFLGPVAPSTALQREDRLVFTGLASTVADLRRYSGLVPATDRHYEPTADRPTGLFEVVVSETSPLVGTTPRDVRFRSRYEAAVLAVHRAGQRVPSKLGEVEFRAGDTLILEASEDFDERWADSREFALISRVRGEPPPRLHKAKPALLVLVVLVCLVAFNVLPMVTGALLAAGAMVLLGVLTPREARSALELPVLIVIGAAIGLGKAVETTGIASTLAGALVELGKNAGASGILAATYLLTVLLTEAVTNVAAAALLFPVVMNVAERTDLEPRAFAVVLALAASASFMTPTGYQTNLLVYGPGGYRYTDFLRLGGPMALAVFAVAMVVIPWAWPLLP